MMIFSLANKGLLMMLTSPTLMKSLGGRLFSPSDHDVLDCPTTQNGINHLRTDDVYICLSKFFPKDG